MILKLFYRKYLPVVLAGGLLSASAAYAEKPSWAGGGKHDKHRQHEQHPYSRHGGRQHRDDGRSRDEQIRPSYHGGTYFGERQRSSVRDYYAGEFRSGHCPPGLAKKHNGCLPPGQAKSWRIGQPLPPDVIYYDLPPAVALSIGPPPLGYRFVRVASDILMIATGTAMVMDAIRDLGGL